MVCRYLVSHVALKEATVLTKYGIFFCERKCALTYSLKIFTFEKFWISSIFKGFPIRQWEPQGEQYRTLVGSSGTKGAPIVCPCLAQPSKQSRVGEEKGNEQWQLWFTILPQHKSSLKLDLICVIWLWFPGDPRLAGQYAQASFPLPVSPLSQKSKKWFVRTDYTGSTSVQDSHHWEVLFSVSHQIIA